MKPSNSTKTPVKKEARPDAGDGATRRERLESKEAAIVAVAYDMFASKGFAKSTMSEIAKTAGVAEGTLYLYFNNKEALARAAIASFYEQLTVLADEGVASKSSAKEKLEFLATHHLENIIKEKRILQLLSILDRQTDARASDAVYAMNKRYVAVFDAVFREGCLTKEIGGSFTAWIARDVFFGALEYAMRTIEITGRQSELGQFVSELVEMMVGTVNDETDNDETDNAPDLASMSAITARLETVAVKMEKLTEDSK